MILIKNVDLTFSDFKKTKMYERIFYSILGKVSPPPPCPLLPKMLDVKLCDFSC